MGKGFFTEFMAQSFEIVTAVILVGMAGVYLFYPEIFEDMAKTSGASLPLGVLFLIYILTTSHKVKKIKKEAEKDGGEKYNEYHAIYVSQKDELKNDGIVVITVIIMILIAKLIEGKIDYADLWQAGITIIAIYWTKKIYFKEYFSFFGKNKFE